MWVENRSDDLWVGVKGQSSLEIAGTPRNISKYSLVEVIHGGKAQFKLGAARLPNFY